MITKIKLYLAFLLFYAKQIRMRGLSFSGLYACSSVCIRRLMWNK